MPRTNGKKTEETHAESNILHKMLLELRFFLLDIRQSMLVDFASSDAILNSG